MPIQSYGHGTRDIEMLSLSTIIDDTLLRRLTEEGFFFCRLTKRRERDIMLMY